MTQDPSSPTPLPSIASLLAQRWSPRVFDATHQLSTAELTSLFEAARWAPSASNGQPWRFLAGRRGDTTFETIQAQLMHGNQAWTFRASALVAVCAQVDAEPNTDGEAPRWARHDAGQAAAHLTLQAVELGLAAHQMAGYRAAALGAELALPDHFEVVVVVAIGRAVAPGDLPDLDPDLAARELLPRTRLPLSELVFSETFDNPAPWLAG